MAGEADPFQREPLPAAPELHRSPSGRYVALTGGPAPEHLGALVGRHGTAEVWLTPTALAAWGLPAELPRGDQRDAPHPWITAALADGWAANTAGELRPWLRIWRPGTDHEATISVPSWDRSGPWHRCADQPAELLASLERFSELLGLPWSHSGAITSDRLLRATHARRGGLRHAATERTPLREPDEHDFVWRRPADDRERDATWCHGWDLNGMYLGAASSLALPTGAPVHLAGPLPVDRRPGWWRIDPPEPDDGMPDPYRPRQVLGRRRSTDRTVWVTTSVAQLAGTALEAWVWPEHHQHLAAWYRTLRDARTALMSEGGGPALAAVKAVYRAGIGRLGSSRRSTADELEQPEWRAQLIGTARARLYRRLEQLAAPPVAVNVDAAWFLLPEADPAKAAELLGLPVGDGLGQFRHIGRIDAHEARELLATPGMDAPVLNALTKAAQR